ncbi:hypothetical protein [Cellulomonas xiejunii]|uniref:Uncharacterized protein n=1 Tax=Cellulomonas xiejunii TaxID=2968083 RepID=A0ABY5KVH9_9CELL|nr:hypothetical protein [Cellulomonas xiejunii]MCC2321316.1 hypothetical protein [Cellulomonas xiejunii]UUI73843.1 hypothetical protein NP048_00010 [Cellulomonas xiejunii]
MNGRQGPDPAKLGAALVTMAALDPLPLRFVGGADAVTGVEQKAHLVLEQVDAHRERSIAMSIDGS